MCFSLLKHATTVSPLYEQLRPRPKLHFSANSELYTIHTRKHCSKHAWRAKNTIAKTGAQTGAAEELLRTPPNPRVYIEQQTRKTITYNFYLLDEVTSSKKTLLG